MGPEVSIITPCYNCSLFVQEAIDSVKSQTYPDWEQIIVDDCSSDDSYEIVSKNSFFDSRIRPVQLKERCGPATARNTAIKMACGRYIAFLDSDDMWLPEKLEKQIALMKRTDATLSYTAYEKIDIQGKRDGRLVHVPASGDYNTLLTGCFIGCLTAIYDTEKIGKVYMPSMPRGQDYGLWLKILRSGHVAVGLDQVLALYRERKGSLSSSKLRKAYYQWQVYRSLENLSFMESMKCFWLYGKQGIRKRMI